MSILCEPLHSWASRKAHLGAHSRVKALRANGSSYLFLRYCLCNSYLWTVSWVTQLP